MANLYWNAPRTTLKAASFSFYSPEEIQSLSALKVEQPVCFDNLGTPVEGGLYDPRMGPVDKLGSCPTCRLSNTDCPGHRGSIDLSLPVFNPILFGHLFQLLRCKCFACHKFRLRDDRVKSYEEILRLLDAGELEKALDFHNLVEHGLSQAEKTSDIDDTTPTDGITLHNSRQDYSIGNHYRQSSRCGQEGSTVMARKRVVDCFFKRAASLKKCEHCSAPAVSLRKDGSSKIFQLPLSKRALQQLEASGQQIFGVAKTQKLLSENKKGSFLTALYGSWKRAEKVQGAIQMSPETFFLSTLIVPPNRFRPPMEVGGAQFEHPQNMYFMRIINANKSIILEGKQAGMKLDGDVAVDEKLSSSQGANMERILAHWLEMQDSVNCLMDSSLSSKRDEPRGIRQDLEKKEGLFRKNMMGKRVNFACRSVISPDPYLDSNEVGIPTVFAKKLSYPQPVTPWNIREMRTRVENGAFKLPGATFIEDDRGNLIDLSRRSDEARKALAQTLLKDDDAIHACRGRSKKVWRHLTNGDYVLVNRQPTLHKPGIMAHRVRIIENQKTIRLHYANCSTFNADFDGDEMNVHLPQDEISRAEAASIAFSDRQYIVPTNGKPIRGLIQDHVVAAVLLTKKDTFYDLEEYQQMVYMAIVSAIGGRLDGVENIALETPAIIFPTPKWTGKQVINALLRYLTSGRQLFSMEAKCKAPASQWGDHSEEGTVIIHDSYLCTGVLDKSQIGSTDYGLIHCCYELYGPVMAGKLLSALGRLFTYHLQRIGFTLGIEDLVLQETAELRRSEILDGADASVVAAAEEFIQDERGRAAEMHGPAKGEGNNRNIVRLLSRFVGEQMEKEMSNGKISEGGHRLDGLVRGRLNKITSGVLKGCIPRGQRRPFPGNAFALITLSGAKGSVVNHSQISCCLGQQELEGRRVPLTVAGRSLPCFEPFETTAKAGGYIRNRFLTGISPAEYYFHCMAGREGLVDTAVKTARSGYLQRCVVKTLEGLHVQYDRTVRDSDGSIIQFQYGEDGIDVTQTRFLQKFDFNARNISCLLEKHDPDLAVEAFDAESVFEYKNGDTVGDLKRKSRDPLLAIFDPSRHFGAVSEMFEECLDRYIESHSTTDGLLRLEDVSTEDVKVARRMAGTDANIPEHQAVTIEKFRALMQLKYHRSVVDAGEAVGVLTAQSIGEPSTQMTLNTFHLAGTGAGNVTLGIPRLREIITTAAKELKTPLMVLPLKRAKGRDVAERIVKRLKRVTVMDVAKEISVDEQLHSADVQASNRTEWRREYRVYLKVVDQELLSQKFSLSGSDVRTAMEEKFVRQLRKLVGQSMKRFGQSAGNISKGDYKASTSSTSAGAEDEAEEDEQVSGRKKMDTDPTGEDVEDEEDMEENETVNEEDGTSGAKSVSRHKEQTSYDEADDEELLNEEHADSSDREEGEDSKARSVNSTTKNREEDLGISDVMEGIEWLETDDEIALLVTVSVPLELCAKKLLMVGLAEEAARAAVIRATAGIDNCYLLEGDGGTGTGASFCIQTEGVNFVDLFELAEDVDLDHILSNHIYLILQRYGVEAARDAITREIKSVFGAYGIGVDGRHLSLLADYMTFNGDYRACNRIGMDYCSSPFQKMSFETTLQFLKKSLIGGEAEDIKSPSASIVLGQPVKLGTGLVDILQKPI